MIETKVELVNREEVLAQFVIPKEDWTPADEMLYGQDDFFNIPEDEADRLRFKAIKYAFDYQYSENAFYRNFCQAEGVAPGDIKKTADLIKIPKIPDTFFKDYPSTRPKEFYSWLRKTSAADIGRLDFDDKISLDKLLDEIELGAEGVALHSSGTSGRFSIIVRDKVGSLRWGYAIAKAGLFSIVSPSTEAHAVYLGPSRTHLTFGRLMFELPRVFQTANIHCLIDRKLTVEMIRVAVGMKKGVKESVLLYLMRRALVKARGRMVRVLQMLDNERRQVYIIAPPYEVYELIMELKKLGIRLNLGSSNSVVFTSAGWKIFEYERVSEQRFRAMVEEILGIPGEHCRDVYAMSEWHGLAWECEGHFKHIIQCTYPMVLDENLEPLGYGEYGRFAFLDPLSNTFPGFIITGDRVKMLQRCPVCNRTSPVLEPEITRVAGAESRGCGDLMRKMMAEELAGVAE